jgi:gentisate 1,2-dioxygenase
MENVHRKDQSFDQVSTLDQLYDVLGTVGMGPGWNKPEPSLWAAPKKTFVPAHWPYSVARAALSVAGDLVSTELAERRNLILANPVPGNTYPTARTLVAAYQMVKARESARSHRHTPNALRLVVEAGLDTYTIVQGKKVPMEPGDVLLTPNWLWHGHSNESDTDAYWIDFLDAPLVQLLEPMFFEHFPDGIEKPEGVDENSPMRFAWSETKPRVDAAAPVDGVREIELGRPALDTISLKIRRIDAGASQPVIQTTANNVYAVIDGSGQTEIDNKTISWRRGDVFVAPGWWPHRHVSRDGGYLLRVTDEPVLTKLNWLRARGA